MANLSNIITPTNVLTATSTNTVTNKTISGANNTITDVSLTGATGTLPVANGGTGAASLTANNVLLGNGTSALQAVAPGTSGNVLVSNGSTWTSGASPADGPAINPIGGWYTYETIGNFNFGPTFSRISDGVYIAGFPSGNIRVITYNGDGTFSAGAATAISPVSGSFVTVVMLTSTVGVVMYNSGALIRAFTVSGTTVTMTGTAVALTSGVSMIRLSDTAVAVQRNANISQFTVSAGQVSAAINIASGTFSEMTMTALSPTILLVNGTIGVSYFMQSYFFNGTNWTAPTGLNKGGVPGSGIMPTNPRYTGNVYDSFTLAGTPPDRYNALFSVSVNLANGVLTTRYNGVSLWLPEPNFTSMSDGTNVTSTPNVPSGLNSGKAAIYKLDDTKSLFILTSRPGLNPQAVSKTAVVQPCLYVFNSTTGNFLTISGFVPLGVNLPLSSGLLVVDYIESTKTLIISGVQPNNTGGMIAISMKGYL